MEEDNNNNNNYYYKKKKTDNLFTCVKIHSKRYHHDSMVEFVIKKRTQSEP